MLDISFLQDYYTARLATRASGGTSASAAQTTTVRPPWDVRVEQPSEDRRLREALAQPITINLRDPAYQGRDLPEDHRKLFALYKALNTLSTLAKEAAETSTLSGQRAGLDRRFQTGLETIVSFVNETSFDALTLLAGQKTSRVESAIRVARPASTYIGGDAVRGAFDSPVAGLTGTETITFRITKSAGTTDVVLDLATISGPLTLDAIVEKANEVLSNAGMVTKLKRVTTERDEDGVSKAFGIQIEGVPTETIQLIGSDAAPAAYIVGTSGVGTGSLGQVIKLSDLDSASPTAGSRTIFGSETATTAAKASATDAQGNLFVLGTSSGDIDGDVVKGTQDVVLRKYDSAGALLWSQVLGAADSADGLGLAVGSDGSVVIAGRTSSKLSTIAVGGKGDSFVAKFSSSGQELFTRQLAPVVEDGATSVSVASDGSIYLSGYTKARLAGVAAHGGGSDGYVTKLDSNGALVFNRQFGGSGDERASSIAIADDGNLIVSSLEDGIAVVRKYSSADGTSAALWEKTLGSISGGTLGGLTVSNGKVYVVGSTGNTALTVGGEAGIAAGHNGGLDGFVLRIDDRGNSATAEMLSYVGTSGLDRVTGVQVSGGDIYLTGETRGQLPGALQTRSGVTNAFAAKLDASGGLVWAKQFGGQNGEASGLSIAFDSTGSSILDKLGLPRGTLSESVSNRITANGSVRAGESFYLSVDGRADRRIRIEADDTLRSLANKINNVLLLSGKAEIVRKDGTDTLKITAREGKSIELKRGPEGFDALEGLGLSATRIINEPSTASSDTSEEEESEDDTASRSTIFGLSLDKRFSLLDKSSAATAQEALNDALADLRRAYREITRDPALDALAEQQARLRGTVPAYLRGQLANYQAGLARLTSGSSSGSLF
ncbi:MAG: hypothetical protein GC199_10860 [Alphaproteobacteria bacterium]|nr:hypothetical protein [Alphaproteobacteria bacterium]